MTDSAYRTWILQHVASMRKAYAPPVDGDATEYTVRFVTEFLSNAERAFADAFPGEAAPGDVFEDVSAALMLSSPQSTPEGGTK